jgi:hypothetical protein
MKKRLNLLIKGQSYKRLESFFLYFRLITTVAVALLFVVIIVFFFLSRQSQQANSRLLDQKAELLATLLTKKDLEQKALYLNTKGSQLSTYLKEDVNFLPYYKALQDYLPFSSQSATIDKVDYDNKRNVTIVLKFTDYDSFYNSLTLLQDQKFLSIFETLQLESFSISESKINNYTLTLSGKFKPINE